MLDLQDSYIVDFKYFSGNSTNEIFVKEMSLCRLGTLNISTYRFQAPFSKCQLTNLSSIKSNNCIEKNWKIFWDDGNVNYNDLYYVLKNLDCKSIICKGEVKARFLKQYLSNRHIVNLEDLFGDFPKIEELKDYKTYCINHRYDETVCSKQSLINLIMYIESKNLITDFQNKIFVN